MNFPHIVSDELCNPGSLVADNIMTFGYYEAAKIAKKKKVCFTLFYFLAFGRAPRSF